MRRKLHGEPLAAGTRSCVELLDKAKVRDGFYIPTRYANRHPEGPPFEHYGKLQSSEAITYAGEILEFVRAQMAGSQNAG